jgi:hypothetical protein
MASFKVVLPSTFAFLVGSYTKYPSSSTLALSYPGAFLMKIPTSSSYSATDICDTFTVTQATDSDFDGSFVSGLTFLLPAASTNFLSIPKTP